MNHLKSTDSSYKLINILNLKLCELSGHQWLYKDYSNYMKANGDKYEFRASRSCKRCGENAYFYSAWTTEPKSELDYESEYFSLDKIEIDKVVYK